MHTSANGNCRNNKAPLSLSLSPFPSLLVSSLSSVRSSQVGESGGGERERREKASKSIREKRNEPPERERGSPGEIKGTEEEKEKEKEEAMQCSVIYVFGGRDW